MWVNNHWIHLKKAVFERIWGDSRAVKGDGL